MAGNPATVARLSVLDRDAAAAIIPEPLTLARHLPGALMKAKRRSDARERGIRFSSPLLLLFLVAATTMLAYIPAMQGGFIWDDDDYVTQNPVIQSSDGLARIWLEPASLPQYYPMVHTTFWIEYHLWQLNPRGYHTTNVLLHLVGAILLFFILKRLRVPAPLMAAAVFALHPVHVESVAWITERKNTLSGLFFMLSLLAWLHWRPLAGDGRSMRGSTKLYILSFAAFCLALLSKSVTCSLPAVILLLVWWKENRITRNDLLATLPMFAVGLVMAMVTASMEVTHVVARGEAWDLSLVERCLVAGRALWFYAYKLLLPLNLSFNYARWAIDATALIQYLFPAGIGVVTIGLWAMRQRIGRGALVAVLIFAGSLVPALGFFNVFPMIYSFVADHFQYLASIALIALGCGLARIVLGKWLGRKQLILAGGAVLLLLAGLTWNQCGIYRDLETLWIDTMSKNPDSWLAKVNLGGMRLDQGRLDEARQLTAESLAINAANFHGQNNMGIILLQLGEPDAARPHFETAIRQNPDFAQSYNNLAVLLWRQGDLDGALEQVQKALDRIPNYPDALRNMAYIHLDRGAAEQAIPYLSRLLAIMPQDVKARYEAAAAFESLGRVDDAVAVLAPLLVSRSTQEAAVGRMVGLLADTVAAGGVDEAVVLAAAACRPLPALFPGLLDALAAELAGKGLYEEACSTEEEAVKRAGGNQAELYSRRLESYRDLVR